MRRAALVVELVILTALIASTRCANYRDVFISGNVYFSDADCYSRMTRVRLCAAHPGLILRHHQFENYPQGTTPHTTAPLDYLILGLSILLRPLVPNAIDTAGALVSPLLGIGCGWFLWWWSLRMKFRYRWALLILYALSPILVHGTELGRPDHQSLVMLLIVVAICAEWACEAPDQPAPTRWGVIGGSAWAFAMWVSFYEPLILFVVTLLCLGLTTAGRAIVTGKNRKFGLVAFGTILVVALLVEQRMPSISILSAVWTDSSGGERGDEFFRNWAGTIGELRNVSLFSGNWVRWGGYLVIIAPVLIWSSRRKGLLPGFMIGLLIASFGLTIWQARWSYFFMSLFVVALPAILEPIRSRFAVWVAFGLSILPVLTEWDATMWPNEPDLERKIEQRRENVELREISRQLVSVETQPFIAPWWLSPSIAYWSGQPAVAGSSHESLAGIADCARFFLSENPAEARKILADRKVSRVISYGSDRVVSNSASLLGKAAGGAILARTLDRMPSQAPSFLKLEAGNATAKLFTVNAAPPLPP